MALADYTPTLAWFADSVSDTDTPTGTTVTNTGTVATAGTGDVYAEFSGSNHIKFVPGTGVMNVGTGVFTLVFKVRITNWASIRTLFQNYDGSGAAGDNHGMQIRCNTVSRNLSLFIPPRSDSFKAETATGLPDNVDFIIAWRRTTGPTWSYWLDADASGGMSVQTLSTDTIGASNISECLDLCFFADRDGAETGLSGRLYWVLGFNAAISDTDIALSTWDDEAALKTAFGFGATGYEPIPIPEPLPGALGVYRSLRTRVG